jgi:hypothetical protein
MKKAILVSLAASLSAPAFAAGQWNGVTVTLFQPFTNQYSNPGFLQVQFSASATGAPPSCSSGFRAYAAVDLSTSSGALAAQTLLDAKLTGGTVNVVGVGSCAIDGGVETVSYVTLQ